MKIEKGMAIYRASLDFERAEVAVHARIVVGAGDIYITTEGAPGGRDRLSRRDAERRYSPTPEAAKERLRETMREAVKSARRKLDVAQKDLLIAFGEES